MFLGGYIAQELVPVLPTWDFDAWLWMTEEFANKDLFPMHEIIVGILKELDHVTITENDCGSGYPRAPL